MVLDGKQLPSSGFGALDQKVFVNRLQSERVNHADVDAFLGEHVSSSDGLQEGDTRTHHSHFVAVTGADNLGRRTMSA